MKTDVPIEFQIVFSNAADPDGRVSRNFIFPTAPAYLNANTYNQKCMVEFVSLTTDGDITGGNESSINYTTHNGGHNFNNGNISMGTSNPIICDSVWGKSVEIKVYELEGGGSTAATNFRHILSNTIVNIVMRITPFSEEKCGCM